MRSGMVLIVWAMLGAHCLAGQPLAFPRSSASSRHVTWGRLSAGAWLGGLRGHLQTPAGGLPGTTSSHRPTVEEIGLDGGEWMPFLDGSLGIGQHELHVNYVFIERSGGDVLNRELISQSETFPAGSSVRSDFGLSTVRLGYRPHGWSTRLWGWRLLPEIGFGVADFKYRLNSPAATGPVYRTYPVGFYYLGFLLTRPVGRRWRLEWELAGSGGVNGVSFIDSELRAVRRLWDGPRSNWSAVVGWRGSWFRRHDSQTGEQNDPNVRFGALADDPWLGLTLGAQVGF